jgi:tRNA (guanine37-N1)-methyltransferase
VLLSGNHADIRRWRKREALARTLARRPDLLAWARLDDEEREILSELREEGVPEMRGAKKRGAS